MSTLTSAQVAQFEDEGYLFLPSVFDAEEIAHVRGAVETVSKRTGPEVVHELSSDAVRLVYGVHRFDEVFRRLSHHPRVLEPAMQLLGGQVYIHQSRLNPKAAFRGENWAWHQDFATWNDRDGLQYPRAMMIAIFLDDARDVNGPLMIVPRSHKHGLIHDAVDNHESGGYTLFLISPETIARHAAEGGIKPITGPAGSVLFCHCNIVHGSAGNITPWPRRIYYLNVASIDNPPTKFERAEHHCTRDFSSLQPLGDDCLRDSALQAGK